MAIHRLSAATLTGIAFAGFGAMYVLGYFVTDWLVARTLIALAWIATFSVLAWMRLDETAREAHKYAWFYGGGTGLLLMLLALIAIIWSPGMWEQLASRMTGFGPAVVDMPGPLAGFVGGVMACAIAQVIGYGLVWGGWWIRRR